MIYIIGIGLDGPRALSPKAISILRRSALIAGGRRHLEGLKGIEGLTAKTLPITADLSALEARIRETMKKRRSHVSVLATGDPLLYGIGDFIIRTFGRKAVTIIPNVSLIQEAFSRVKESEAGLKVLSLHGRAPDFRTLARSIAENPRAALFTDRVNTPERIARGLMEAGLRCPKVYVCEALGFEEERICSGSLKTISRKKFSHPLGLMLFISEGKTAGIEDRTLAPGIDDALFRHSANMITKAEIRVVSLSKLAPPPAGLIWDIGSCTGSVAIEAARLAHSGRVFAIEKNKKRIRDIRENIRCFGASNVQVVEGEAPACLRGLPAPDAVFVGGGGAGIKHILNHVIKRIRPGGAVVVNAVTLETAGRAMECLRKKGLEPEFVQMGISHGKEISGLTILSASNPVFIIKGVKT